MLSHTLPFFPPPSSCLNSSLPCPPACVQLIHYNSALTYYDFPSCSPSSSLSFLHAHDPPCSLMKSTLTCQVIIYWNDLGYRVSFTAKIKSRFICVAILKLSQLYLRNQNRVWVWILKTIKESKTSWKSKRQKAL